MIVLMSDSEDAVLDEVTVLVPCLTGALDSLAAIARQMHPPRLSALVDMIGDNDQLLDVALRRFRAIDWPPRLNGFRDQLAASADFALSACAGLRAAAISPDGPTGGFRH